MPPLGRSGSSMRAAAALLCFLALLIDRFQLAKLARHLPAVCCGGRRCVRCALLRCLRARVSIVAFGRLANLALPWWEPRGVELAPDTGLGRASGPGQESDSFTPARGKALLPSAGAVPL